MLRQLRLMAILAAPAAGFTYPAANRSRLQLKHVQPYDHSRKTDRKASRGSPWVFLAIAAYPLASFSATAESPSSLKTRPSEFDCVIEPEKIVKLATPVEGIIARLDVDRGDVVREGQILGKLDDTVETAELALARARAANQSPVKSAEARLQFLQRKYERIDALHAKLASSLAALQEAEAEADVAKQLLEEAKLNRAIAQLEVKRIEALVNQRSLQSPINGVVVERLLVPGEYRNEQSPVLVLAQLDQLRVEVFVPTARYGEIRVGSNAEVIPELPFGGTYSANVTVVDRVLDAASGTFGIRLNMPNPGLRLPSGIRCKIAFPSQSEGAVSSSAVSNVQSK